MRKTNKFNALRTKGFASQLEYDTYQTLVGVLPVNAKVENQVPVILKPVTEAYRAITWKIDFKVVLPDGRFLWVESKGFPTDDFKRNLMFFEYRYPDQFDKLIIVVSRRNPELTNDKNLQVVTLSDLPYFLKCFVKNQQWSELRHGLHIEGRVFQS